MNELEFFLIKKLSFMKLFITKLDILSFVELFMKISKNVQFSISFHFIGCFNNFQQ